MIKAIDFEGVSEGDTTSSRGELFIKIWDFMRFDFGLKNTELMVYAIIFAMHRNYCECFSGSREYLMKWSGGSKAVVNRALLSLEERKLILKEYRQYGQIKKAIYFVNADMLPTCEMFALENRHRDNEEKIRRAKARSQKEKH
jgi:predicted transcriptional regulator